MNYVRSKLGMEKSCSCIAIVGIQNWCDLGSRSIGRLGQNRYMASDEFTNVNFNSLILYAIWWGFGEVVRLSLLRRGDRVLYDLSLKWQETLCKFYILSNLGFAEPCLFLTIVFLLRASLQKREFGTLSQLWNGKTAGYVLLNCLPLFAFQCIVVLTGPKFNKKKSYGWKFK
ncbi:hypothetical protein BVC80_1811g29 [Macleaya cordata]|uniref:Uncharacterized protein n=1 Tax=Macleaya cordata TaxID=56857 RepID=A0A200QVT8_MACCD|nr:hypothetical protein BVC80_1811g29 [Macleaya cordata]